MKKLLMVGMSLVMILSLVACSKNDAKDENNTPSIEDNVDNNAQDNTGDVDNSTDENNNEETNNENTATPENQALAEIISSNRDDEQNEAFGIVTSKNDELAEVTFSMLGIAEEDLSEYAITFSPMNVKAYCIAIVKPQEGKKDTVVQLFEDFKDSQEKSFERYLEDQYEIAKNAIIKEVGDYVILVMCEDSSSFSDHITEALK